jgi:putative transferase (TIGR04331 family)
MRDTNKISTKYSNQFLKNNNFSNVVEKIECSLSERITKNDLKFIIVDHISTPFLEIVHSNIPFILILSSKFNFFNKKYNYLIKEMVKEKILFYNPKKAADYLNNIDFKYLNWNKNFKIQKLRQEIMKQFYNQNKNWKEIWRSKIEKIS